MQKTTDLSIDYTLIPSNVPTICIPYVFENIGDKRIEGIFKDLDIGKVDRIDLVPTQNHAPNGSKVNRVFVHINWKIDEDTNKIRTKLLCGKEVKVLYDGKYFWKISASRAKEVKPHHPTPVQKDMKPRIEMDDDSPRDHRGPPRDHRGPPHDHRGPPRDHHGPPRDHRGPRDYRGPPRDHRGPPQEPRDYRPTGDFVPRQVLPPAPGLSDFPLLSLEHPEEFVGAMESPANSWSEEQSEEYQPTTPPTPPVKDTRPFADIDYQEKVPDQTYAGVEGNPVPKVMKKKKVTVKKAAVAVAVEEEEEEA